MDREQYSKLLNLKEEIAERDLYVLSRLSENESFTKLMLTAVVFAKRGAVSAIDRELKEYADKIGYDEVAERMTEEIKDRYSGFLDEKFFNNLSLTSIISAIESGRAQTLDDALKIAETEVEV